MKFPRIKTLRAAMLASLIVVLLLYAYQELSFCMSKQRVLSADRAQLQRLGSHFVIGFTDYNELRQLVRMGAVGGVYITARNVRGKRISEVQQMIRLLQNERKAFGHPPLHVVTDQEGGVVTRLSPPLGSYESLATIVNRNSSTRDLQNDVVRYARKKARQLRSIGVTMNLSPVVDLKPRTKKYFFDLHTHLADRAISNDHRIVRFVATQYAVVLAEEGVIPTVKHFPGLSRVASDTHIQPGRLSSSVELLNTSDWLPFRHVLRTAPAALMVGHVNLEAVDANRPVSISSKVIEGIIRKKWGHDGLIITDDMTMAPVARRRGGIGASSVAALNAGVDLVLISWRPREYYPAMSAVLKADSQGELDDEKLARSRKRLQRRL